MTTIQLRCGMTAEFDDADMPLVVAMNPGLQKIVSSSGKVYLYVTFKKKGRRGLMHRLITGAPAGLDVDHIDGNGLNNKRSNLRVCSHAENMRNRRPNFGKELPKGVGKGSRPTFFAQIKANGIRRNKCGFKTAEDAARQYALWAAELHGNFARVSDADDGPASSKSTQQVGG
jgi:hypothetical protein